MVALLAAIVLRASPPTPQARLDPQWDYDGRRILGAVGKEAFLWDVGTGRLIRRLAGHGDWVSSVLFLPDGRHALTGAGNEGGPRPRPRGKPIRLWDLETGEVVRRFEGLRSHAMSLNVGGDGRRLIAVGSGSSPEDRALVWDMASGKRLFDFESAHPPVHPPTIPCAAFSPDGRTLLVLDSPDVRVLDATNGREVAKIADPVRRVQFQSAVFSPDGKRILTCEAAPGPKAFEFEYSASLWDARKGTLMRRFDGLGDSPMGALFAKGGRIVVVTRGSVLTWDTKTGEPLGRESFATPMGGSSFWEFAIDAAGRRIVLNGSDVDGIVWSIVEGRTLARKEGDPDGRSGMVAFAPDGRTFLAREASGFGEPLAMTVRDADSGKVLRRFVLEGSGKP